jgi:methionine aminotransferase
MIKNSKFKFTPSSGTYFQCVDYSAISDEPDMAFVRWLTVEKGVAAIPLSPFYAQITDKQTTDKQTSGSAVTPANQSTVIRFCFCKDDDTLQRAADVLCSL